ncbi:MAG: hypothetical protein K0S65_6382 [Labilithrix sp.]|nr:hypothetical protein [Labilithrix sp.]
MKRYTRDPATPSHLRKLVDSARGDDLEPRRRRRVAERLGILVSPVAQPSEPASHPASSAKSWVSAKGIALTAVALVGGASYVTFSSSRPPPQPSAFVAPMSPAAPLEAAPSARDVAPPAPASNVAAMGIDALPDSPLDLPTARPVRALAAAETVKSGNDTARSGRGELDGRSPSNANEANLLRLELAALDAVRRATETGRPREALGRLDAYAAKFPSGKLREEAVVLRIEALHASGERSRAAELARRLLRDSPNTPYAARVQAALESDSRE